MSLGIEPVFISIEDLLLKKRVVEEIEDMMAKIVDSVDKAKIIVTDIFDFNHFYLEGIARVVIVNISEDTFELMEKDIREIGIKTCFNRLEIYL
ncbi:hypothetical protein A3E89_02145 [Candidatus Campbellbacteria bacterium RIFCSPHIGHO2_12_FULL_35_10]|uniref:Uncharacterized protein n=1 Tax=Candidatus Campbellbacteria bacterium RIFCSPHIGHO2_12_FULL_35_10 TaxID=1797578 RepID=A0A1F5ENU2_9BACT|nr:MAG: hypothetical protein A3E89_02145 [Candidatus Campbellbacteria bacterium RIFCSPHIGHO2_12_FULL_35_10]